MHTTPLYTLDLPFVVATAQALSARDSLEAVSLNGSCIGQDSMGRRGSWVHVVHWTTMLPAEAAHRDGEHECTSGHSSHTEAFGTRHRRGASEPGTTKSSTRKGNEQEC